MVIPKWRINSDVYTATTLPILHFFDGSGLLVVRVSASMNMSQYTCFFTNIMSNTAILFVVQNKSSK